MVTVTEFEGLNVGEGGSGALLHPHNEPIDPNYNMKGVSRTVFRAPQIGELAIGYALGQLQVERNQENRAT